MKLTESQADILDLLSSAVSSEQDRCVTYCSEWLGYLPFGSYHWVEVGNQEISKASPSGWQRSDLLALESAGHLTKVREWQNPKDEYHKKVTYAVSAAQPTLQDGRPIKPGRRLS